jgi:amino acid transporter
LLLEFAALWWLRRKRPEIKRSKIPGGIIGLFIVTILPTLVIIMAIYSQVIEEGWASIWLALIAIVIGIVLYFVMKRFVKPGIPDINPYEEAPSAVEQAAPTVVPTVVE